MPQQDNFDPLAEQRRGRVIRPDEVRGVMGHKEAEAPTRRFFVVDTQGPSDWVWEVDGYLREMEGKQLWLLHLICPACDKLLSIRSDRKAVEVGEDYLEVEPFGCTWHGDFGQLYCAFRAGIVKPRERVIVTDAGPFQIDGMFKRA